MKLMAGILSCCLLFSCAGLQEVMDLICNPTAEQVADAEAALAFIDAGLALAAGTVYPGATDLIAKLGMAKSVFASIRGKICVTLGQLQEALGVVDSLQALEGAKALKAGRASPLPPTPKLRALRALVVK
jgi:hypothetical protein